MVVGATKWRNGISVQRKHLYEIEENARIPIEEVQNDGSRDRVILDFQLEQGQMGCFANEYLPSGESKDGKNVIDITAAMIDTHSKYVRCHLYDIKDTLGGEHTAVKLCNQWNAGLTYLSNGILNELDGYEVRRDIGVFTRNYDEHRMRNTHKLLEHKLENLKQSEKVPLATRKSYTKIPEYEEQLLAVRMILDEMFRSEGERYPISIVLLSKSESDVYQSSLVV